MLGKFDRRSRWQESTAPVSPPFAYFPRGSRQKGKAIELSALEDRCEIVNKTLQRHNEAKKSYQVPSRIRCTVSVRGFRLEYIIGRFLAVCSLIDFLSAGVFSARRCQQEMKNRRRKKNQSAGRDKRD